MSLSILVLTYNCEIEESITIRSLLNSKINFSGVELCIWNNGPKKFITNITALERLKKKGFSTTFKQTINNAPLSWIYNYFIQNFSNDSYVILDHDSELTLEYLSSILEKKDAFVKMPIILAKGIPQSPCSNGVFSAGPYTKKEYVTAIGSGIIISKEIAEAVRIKYGNVFDENFALYGVDTSFFIRLNKLALTEKLQSMPGFEHSLSRLETESKEVKLFRKVERSYDFGLTLRHYPSSSLLIVAVKQVLLWPFGRNRITISKALKVFITGRHERCESLEFKKLLEG
ncbi:hypothetical protein D3C76_577470 [compost metagenome]